MNFTNIVRSVFMGILSGNPQDEPMHYGEVFLTWSFLLTAKQSIAGYQTKINHAGDEDLKKLVDECIQQCQQESKQIEALLKENGVGLPPAAPERPNACLDDIPVGARFQDPEISAHVSAVLGAGLIACSGVIVQCIREDIAMMFGQFHTQKAALAAKALRLNKEKGWLIPPPLHHSKGENC